MTTAEIPKDSVLVHLIREQQAVRVRWVHGRSVKGYLDRVHAYSVKARCRLNGVLCLHRDFPPAGSFLEVWTMAGR